MTSPGVWLGSESLLFLTHHRMSCVDS
jgi:hypothetical protein